MPSTETGSTDKDRPGFVPLRRSQRSLRAPPRSGAWAHRIAPIPPFPPHSGGLSLAVPFLGEPKMPNTPVLPVLYRPTDAARLLNLSRSTIFDLMRSGRLRSVKEGRIRLVAASAIADYVALLESEAA